MNKETIHRFLSGELSEDKVSELLKCVNKSEANRKYYAHNKNLWTASRLDQFLHEIDPKKEFELLNLKIEGMSDKDRRSRRSFNKDFFKNPWLIYLLRAAAILVLLYSIISSYYFINERNKISYTEITTNRGEKASVQLADGTRVWLNSETRLCYPTNLNSKEVKVYLEGEAYFDVEKIPNRTFIVKASSLDIAVLGTSFNVKSYAAENRVETTLEEGKISITGKMGHMRLKDPVVLKPNQQVTFKTNSNEYSISDLIEKTQPNDTETGKSIQTRIDKKVFKPEIIIAEHVESKLYTSWKDGKLVFEREKLESLAIRIERWYDVKIYFADEVIKEQIYTGAFEKETLEQALKALSLSYPFNFEINQNIVSLSSKDSKQHERYINVTR